MTARRPQRTTQRPPVDWPGLHARLQAAIDRNSADGCLSESAGLARMLERARRFARVPEEPAASADRVELLEFELGPDRMAVEARHVSTVRALKVLTPLPGTPAHWRGIVDVRGSLLAVLDLAVWLQLPRRGLTQLDQLIVLQVQARAIAVLADRIVGVRSVARGALRRMGDNSDALMILDCPEAGSGRLLLLDVEHLLAHPDLAMDRHG